jgi:thioredoxin reductase (NADPH)
MAYDLLVIGGGSGGIACAKAAAQLGKRVALCNFVTPSPAGTTWGLGGTCVNVGCVPKKLMHQAALLGQSVKDATGFGWPASCGAHDWSRLVAAVRSHVKSLSFMYRSQLSFDRNIDYLNARASFVDSTTVKLVDAKGDETYLTSRATVVAVGGRPRSLRIPGSEHCITSDDLFSLETPPGRTLVVGGSYVALECAGFLRGLGYRVCVLVRSELLRGFDRDMVDRVRANLEACGVRFVFGATPTAVVRNAQGGKECTWQRGGIAESEVFDTVLMAVGRAPSTAALSLDAAGVVVSANGKIPTVCEQTNVPNIYAIGDVMDGASLDPPCHLTELSPVAIRAGQLLAARLFGGGSETMSYATIPTTVFTPLEYGFCGLTESAAESIHGRRGIEVYHSAFKPLEWVPSRPDDECYVKLICTADSSRVVGLHICGPNAADVTQGFAVAMRMGATKADFDSTFGIHPSVAEAFVSLTAAKRDGTPPRASGC